MQYGRKLQLILCLLFCAGITAAMAQESQPAQGKVVEENGVITLAPGPNIDGLVFLHGSVWTPEIIKTFNEIPWLDAGSIRLGWGQVETKDQEFNWKPFDDALAVVKKYNAGHPDAHRILHIRVMAGKNCPKWMEAAGVKYYDTLHSAGRTIHLPKPYDNPEYMKQLRELYRAMYERYKDAPEVAVYHGTWSGALWAEIFHPTAKDAPLPEDYTKEKFQQGMVEQTDILIDEFCMRGKIGEMAFSGIYPDKKVIDIVGPVIDRAVERLGKRSPFLYVSNNGWGMTGRGTQTASWGHEEDLDYAFGKLNCAFQALGMNKNKKEGVAMSQGDWIPLVDMLKKYDAAYAEVYSPDFMPIDTKHHIEEAFNGQPSVNESSSMPTTASTYLSYRAWLKQWNRLRYVREGTLLKTFKSDKPRRIAKLEIAAKTPEATSIKSEVRVRLADGGWSEWTDASDPSNLQPTTTAEARLTLHTDDGYFTPAVEKVEVVWE